MWVWISLKTITINGIHYCMMISCSQTQCCNPDLSPAYKVQSHLCTLMSDLQCDIDQLWNVHEDVRYHMKAKSLQLLNIIRPVFGAKQSTISSYYTYGNYGNFEDGDRLAIEKLLLIIVLWLNLYCTWNTTIFFLKRTTVFRLE